MFRRKEITRYIILVAIMVKVLNIVHVTRCYERKAGYIYILIWTPPYFEPFNFIEMGKNAFKNCDFENCFLTADRNLLGNIRDFDVVMFNVVNLSPDITLPSNRSAHQKYCLVGLDAAGYHSMPIEFNEFFNITFTYKLSSNVTIPYVVVKDENDEIIGPQIDMPWKNLTDMNETSDYVKSKLQNKSIAAAWIVSHCETPWRRRYAQALEEELAQYGHSLDIYGKCGSKQCPKGGYGLCGNFMCPQYERMDECSAIIESDYYFYLSFENSYGEDYVTEKLLHALEHFAVPVVFGGGNYDRFMPEGIYLDANTIPPHEMAETMNEIISDKNKYYEFFKWHDYYSYHFSGEDRYSGEVCRLCAFLNKSMNISSTFQFIAEWWNEPQPPWPDTEPEFDPQNDAEKLLTNLIDFINPP